MKVKRNMNFSTEEFSDGEMMLYDNLSEMYHILNYTAVRALNILETHDYDCAKKLYAEWAKENFPDLPADSFEDDFDALISDLVEKKILLIG